MTHALHALRREHRILIADDDPIFLKLLQSFLQKEGLETFTAENGKTAVELALIHQPPLILLDAYMPEVDGIEACRQIKQAFPDATVQVLLITASQDQELIEQAFEAGASDYITKPINWRLLKHRVNYELNMANHFQALLNSEHRFRVLFEEAPIAFAVLDQTGHITSHNPALNDLFHTSMIKGADFAQFLQQEVREQWYQDLKKLVAEGEMAQQIYPLDTQPVTYIQLNARLIPAIEQNQPEILCIVEDVTTQVLQTQQLHQLAITDPLTQLLNRRAFDQSAQQYFYLSQKTKLPFSIIMLDIDHFKKINDTYGHPVGDEVLVHLAQLIPKQLHREFDQVYRLGGEEFAILLPETPHEGALAVAERVRAAVEKHPAPTQAGEIPFTISAGVATYPYQAQETTIQSLNDLINLADQALYRAKQSGRNRVASAFEQA